MSFEHLLQTIIAQYKKYDSQSKYRFYESRSNKDAKRKAAILFPFAEHARLLIGNGDFVFPATSVIFCNSLIVHINTSRKCIGSYQEEAINILQPYMYQCIEILKSLDVTVICK
jgi:hypothetical protein